MKSIKIPARGTRAVEHPPTGTGAWQDSADFPGTLATTPDPVLRDNLQDTPAWGGGVHTWCRCGCTGDEAHFRNVNWRVDFPFIEE